MKTFLTLTLYLVSLALTAQDTFLPKEGTIYLHSGKLIKNTTLWRIDSVRVEYVIHGNLADVSTRDISKIETQEFQIEFDEHYQMKKRGYDIIVLTSNDTLRGVIQRIDDGVITYRPVGSDREKRVMKYEVKSYLQWNEQLLLQSSDSISSLSQSRITYEAPDEEDSSLYDSPALMDQTDLHEKEKDFFYHQSYERGVRDALADQGKSAGWGGGGFVLGMTVGSPFLFAGAANSKVNIDRVPNGVDEKLYKAAYQNEIVKKRSRKAAGGAIAGKLLILIILIASL